MSELHTLKAQLLELSHELGDEQRHLSILGEGNTSAKRDAQTFLVKASGSCLGSLVESELVECRFEPLLSMLDRSDLTDQQVEDCLFGCRVDPAARKPSVEALFHAYLLSLPDVRFVGHTHSVAVNQILCSDHAEVFAERRIFPDQVVCCGAASVFIPYTDPGLKLSQMIRQRVEKFMNAHGVAPRVILLESHGIITFGSSPEAVKAAMYMMDKAARVYVGSASIGRPKFMSEEEVFRIANRIDEHYRQRALKI